ncbi:hypothetical protein DPMN_102320 [Dreissena polymorpha]|uniref:Uncharacterized protein n=1 Tax=Dreissena polymorpha TaxID=45954 RepID=A0A9D4LKV7_DREPO|nr:hypothetical protein DPMN_102320 [Dreissena polymorpha]
MPVPRTGTIFELIQNIIRTNVLTKFHEDWTINVISTVLTKKNAPSPDCNSFQQTGTILELIQSIIETNILTMFHKHQTINVASIGKNALPPGGHTNLLTKFHEDRTINLGSKVLTRKNIFQPIGTIFELVQDIIVKKFLTKFHEDQTINVSSRVLTRTNLLGIFHDDRIINVVFRVLIRFYYIHMRKNASLPLPLVAMFFNRCKPFCELVQDIIGTNLLTKFHEDQTITVAFKVLTRQILTIDKKVITNAHHGAHCAQVS